MSRLPRGNEKFHGRLPGGRSPYFGPDAYTSQMNEYNFRRDNQFPGNAVDGRIIENVDFASGETKLIQHGLRRNYVGFMPLNVRARPCAFRARLETPQTVSGATVLNVDTVVYNDGNVFNSTTHAFTAPFDGRFRFDGTVTVDSIVSDGSVVSAGFRNGTNNKTLSTEMLGSAQSGVALTFSREHFLSAGTTTLLWVSPGTSTETIRAGGDSTYFTGRVVGSPTPYIDAGSTADTKFLIPLHAERPLTCDLWIY